MHGRRAMMMALLYDAAAAWDKLLNTSYQFTYGKSGNLHEISLSFQADQFAHLCGIHYIHDIDLKIPYGKADLPALVLSGGIDAAAVEKSSSWEKIKGRMESIIRLEAILDAEFTIYLFQKNRLPFHSDIEANFLLKNQRTGDVVFLFVSGPLSGSFCCSVFPMNNRDYSCGQRKLSLLRKIKYHDGEAEMLFDRLSPPPSTDNNR